MLPFGRTSRPFFFLPRDGKRSEGRKTKRLADDIKRTAGHMNTRCQGQNEMEIFRGGLFGRQALL